MTGSRWSGTDMGRGKGNRRDFGGDLGESVGLVTLRARALEFGV